MGVTLDAHLTYTLHIDFIITRASRRVNILKAVASTNWGQQKDTILITYKFLIRPFSSIPLQSGPPAPDHHHSRNFVFEQSHSPV